MSVEKGTVVLPLIVFTAVMNLSGAALHSVSDLDIASSFLIGTVIGVAISSAILFFRGSVSVKWCSDIILSLIEKLRIPYGFTVGAIIGFNVVGAFCMVILGTDMLTGTVCTLLVGVLGFGSTGHFLYRKKSE